MKNGLKNLTAGTLLLIMYSIIGTWHSGHLQGPTYVVNFVIRTSLQDGNIFAIVFWFGSYVVAFACIILGIRHIAVAIYKHFSKQPVDKINVPGVDKTWEEKH